jgi:antitoxin (DNA-binding transcriptional repressor) of toxin-antitoxin stability system
METTIREFQRNCRKMRLRAKAGEDIVITEADGGHRRILTLMQTYQDVPMSLAHACLARLSEKIRDSVVITLDSDFLIYRRNRREKIPLLLPPRLVK